MHLKLSLEKFTYEYILMWNGRTDAGLEILPGFCSAENLLNRCLQIVFLFEGLLGFSSYGSLLLLHLL